jgi:hypothetical protein
MNRNDAAAESIKPPVQPSPGADRRKARDEVQRLPLLKAAIDLLDAQIVNIDDDFGKTTVSADERTVGPDSEEM